VFGFAAGAFVAFTIWITPSDDCRPNNTAAVMSPVIGGAMLMAGCPDERTPRLIYRNDGSVTPP
jgi:hypothetical protein